MNLFKSTLAVATLMCISSVAFAHHEEGRDHMKAMDTNGDGMISKDEFMKASQDHWDKMPKNKDGMVVIADMEKMHEDKMMKHEGHDAMMKKSDPAKKDGQ